MVSLRERERERERERMSTSEARERERDRQTDRQRERERERERETERDRDRESDGRSPNKQCTQTCLVAPKSFSPEIALRASLSVFALNSHGLKLLELYYFSGQF